MERKVSDPKELTLVQEVFPGDTNYYGTMFGGAVIAMMDKAAGICATKFAHLDFVTASVDRLKFLTPIKQGAIIEAKARVVYTSEHTAGLKVTVVSRDRRTWEEHHCCTAYFFMVAIDEEGKVVEIPQISPDSEEEKKEFEEARALHEDIKE